MWASVGLGLSVALAAFAWYRATRSPENYYSQEVYGMTAPTHRRYALVSLAFAAFFVAALVTAVPAAPALALVVLIAILYLTSFLRGYSDEE